MPKTAEILRRDIPKRGGDKLHPPRAWWDFATPSEPSSRAARKRLDALIEPDEVALTAARGWLHTELALLCVTDRRVIAVPLQSSAEAKVWVHAELRAVIPASIDWFDALVLLPSTGRYDVVNVTKGDARRLADAAAPFTTASETEHESSGDWWKHPGFRLAVRCDGRLVGWSDHSIPPATETVVWTTSNGVHCRIGDEETWIDWDEIVDFSVTDAAGFVEGLGKMHELPTALIVKAKSGTVVVAVETPRPALALQLSTPLQAFGHVGRGESVIASTVVGAPTTADDRSAGPEDSGRQLEPLAILSFALGVLALVTVGVGAPFAWFGIGVGIWAFHRIDGSARVRGKAVAWWGVGMSIAALAAVLGNVAANGSP